MSVLSLEFDEDVDRAACRLSREKRESRAPIMSWILARARYAGLAGMTVSNIQRISDTRHQLC